MILPASQRLSVSVIMATIAAAAGAMTHQRVDHALDIAGRRRDRAAPRMRSRPRRSVAGDGRRRRCRASAGPPWWSATAKPAIQSRMRPTGYHSIARRGRRRAVAGRRRSAIGPAEQREMAEPPGRQRDHDDKGDAVGQAEHQRRGRCCGDAADRRGAAVPSRAPPPSAAAARDRTAATKSARPK